MNVLIYFCRKIYRVTATINCNAKTLVDKWIKSGDDFCSWNKTLLEFKILKKISDSVALTYQVRPTVNCHVPGQIQTEEVYHFCLFLRLQRAVGLGILSRPEISCWSQKKPGKETLGCKVSRDDNLMPDFFGESLVTMYCRKSKIRVVIDSDTTFLDFLRRKALF